MGDGRQPRIYSRAKVAAMFERIRRTEKANREREREEVLRRQNDPFEIAKLALQRRGLQVYAHSVNKPGSKLIVVGRSLLTRDQVIARAARYLK